MRLAAMCILLSCSLAGQQNRVALKSNVHPKAQAQYDQGLADPAMEIGYATLLLKPSPEQQAALDQLLMEQQDPTSPNYHKWLTPEQYADRFGASRDDIAKITSWLQAEGLDVNDVARGRRWIAFTGTAERVGRALRTEIHRYSVAGKMHFANATAPSVPAGLGSMVEWIDGLNDFRETSYMVEAPEYNSGSSHYLAPDDLATIYNITPLYNAGIDGSGQKIVIAGQSSIDINDIRAFRKQFNLPTNDPQLVLYGKDPGQLSLGEPDLDIEWSGAVARKATIIYVYSTSVSTSVQYAVDQNLAPFISYSYGTCEQATSPARRSTAQQANAQGITWLVSSGDSGAAGCDPHGSTSTRQATLGLAASFPASIPEVTAVGGTQLNDTGGNYWASANNANGASARSYIPETAWNRTGNSLSSTGGGASIFFSKPAWQTGPGVPNDNARDIPDISLSASTYDAYLTVSGGVLSGVGGTSASAPAFAGVLALVNQYLVSNGAQPGLGNVNPNLYRLAQTAPSVFHDVTTGDNVVPCAQSSPNCLTGSFGYSAGPGYDLATGLGTVDVNSLVHQWSATATPTTLTLTANPAAVSMNGSTQLTATVTAAGGATPSGTVDFSLGGAILGTVGLKGSGASASAALTIYGGQLATGNNTIMAMYGGSGDLDGSSAPVTVNVTMPTGSSAVVATFTPNPVFQSSTASTWTYTITLTEKAGVATTLTDLLIDGVSYAGQITSFFGKTNIAAKGTLTASLAASGLTPPVTRIFVFTGADANGQHWTQQVPVSYYGPQIGSTIGSSMTPSTVLQNPNADPSCQFAQQVSVRDYYGAMWQITGLKAGSTDLTSQIPQIFGTTRLGPFAGLLGTVCWSGITPPQSSTLEIDATISGSPLALRLTPSFRGPAATPATLAASADHIALAAESPTAALAVALSDPAQTWSAAIFPSNASTNWLTISPTSGTGPGQITLQAAASGQAKGAYRATIILQSTNTTPQYLNVPVSFVVGTSASTSIAGVTNGASFQTAFAPGMIMSVFGTQLAPSTQAASSIPLPLTMAGVSATVNGIAAPLYYVSPGQLNVQVPYETGAGQAVLGVNNNGQIASYNFQVASSAPGIFAGGGNLVPNSTGKQGQTLLLFVTGEGDVTPLLTTGTTPSSSTSLANLPKPLLPVSVTVGGVQAALAFVGIPSGLAGTTQINFTIPANAPLGVQPVVVTVGGAASQAANLTVTQ